MQSLKKILLLGLLWWQLPVAGYADTLILCGKYYTDTAFIQLLRTPDSIFSIPAADSQKIYAFLTNAFNIAPNLSLKEAKTQFVQLQSNRLRFDSAVHQKDYVSIFAHSKSDFPKCFADYKAIAFACFQLKKPDSCIIYNRLAADTTDSSQLLFAMSYEQLHQTDSALFYYRQLAAKNSGNGYYSKKTKALQWSHFVTDNWYYLLSLLLLGILLIVAIVKIITKKNNYE